MSVKWDRRNGWHASWRGTNVWGYRTPWGALYGSWRLSRGGPRAWRSKLRDER